MNVQLAGELQNWSLDINDEQDCLDIKVQDSGDTVIRLRCQKRDRGEIIYALTPSPRTRRVGVNGNI